MEERYLITYIEKDNNPEDTQDWNPDLLEYGEKVFPVTLTGLQKAKATLNRRGRKKTWGHITHQENHKWRDGAFIWDNWQDSSDEYVYQIW